MTPSARLQAVLEILQRIEASRIPMDGTVGDYMRHRKYIGAKDRSNIVERVYAIIRANARIGWWLDRVGVEGSPVHDLLAWLALGEGMDAKRIDDLFDGSQYGPPALEDADRDLLQKLNGQSIDHPDMPDAVRAECPPQWEEAMKAQFGDRFLPEMAATIPPASLDLRVNLRKITREKAIESLAKDNVHVTPSRWSPWGLRTGGKVFLSKTKAFTKGLIEIQDEGSQLIAYVCGVKPGMQVLDYCAGAGGKTLALASAMSNKGRIVACDIDEGRLMKARPRFKRAEVHDIIEVRPLSDEKNRKWLRRQKGTFDCVLIDAPCSGTGTWRRNPDLRWRSFGPSLETLMATQVEILDRVAKTVKPGGRLVYATCSLLRAENEDQIDAFLKREPDFSVLPLAQAWAQDNDQSTPEPPNAGPYMRLTPLQHDTDGFFAAVLVKNAAPQGAGGAADDDDDAET